MNWDEYFLNMLPTIAVRSKDPNTKVGCVIVGPDHEVRSMGYNSFPRGIDDKVPERQERPEKYFWIEHADRNAIYNAARVGIPLKGCTMYLPFAPCTNCARGIIQAGIVRVMVDGKTHDAKKDDPTWRDDFKRTEVMLKEAGVGLWFWYPEDHLSNLLQKG